MYAPIVRAADAPAHLDRYVERVESVSAQASRLSRSFRQVNPWLLDAVLGSVFTVAGLVSIFADVDTQRGFRGGNAFGVLLALACTLPFFVRRRFPLGSGVVSMTALVVLATMGFQNNLFTQMLFVTAYTFGAHCDGARRVIGFLALLVGVLVVAIIGIPDTTVANIAVVGSVYVAAFFLGSTLRIRRLYMQQLEERAAEAERERDEEAKRAVADERLRIAQDLHDVVAHSMGVIAVQAGVGAHVIDTDPAEAKKSLEAIGQTSRQTLGEIRRMLGVLRADEGAEYSPAPGLGDLERLVHSVCDAGVDVHVTWEGSRTELPPGVDFTAYRIVQESLTNVLKHAGPEPHVDVTIGYEPDVLRLEIVDDGRGVNGRGSDGGHGLMGMRERVGVYGGTFAAGPNTGGGFRVVAELPYGAPE